jgi:hypothetical protein
MSLPAIVDQLEDVPEAARAFYVETEDGRFKLDADGVEDVAGLKSALEKEREARKELKAELAALKAARTQADEPEPELAQDADPDADPEAETDESEDETAEANQAEADQVDADQADPDQTDDGPAESEPKPEIESADPVVLALQSRLIEAEARAAIVAARGAPELLLPVLLPRLRVTSDTETGFPTIFVVDETGAPLRRGRAEAEQSSPTPRSGPDGKGGNLLTVADLIERLRADPLYARAFDGSGKAGSGAPTAGRGEGGPVTVSLSDPRAIARHVADIASGRVRVA